MAVSFNYLESNLLTCALKHSKIESLKECKTCNTCEEQVEKITSALSLWYCINALRHTIKSNHLKKRVTAITTNIEDCIENLEKMASLSQPIVFGGDKSESYLIVRFVDSVHNKNENISEDSKSFAFLTFVIVPQCWGGFVGGILAPVKSNTGIVLKPAREIGDFDDPARKECMTIDDFRDLLTAKLPGKTVM